MQKATFPKKENRLPGLIALVKEGPKEWIKEYFVLI